MAVVLLQSSWQPLPASPSQHPFYLLNNLLSLLPTSTQAERTPPSSFLEAGPHSLPRSLPPCSLLCGTLRCPGPLVSHSGSPTIGSLARRGFGAVLGLCPFPATPAAAAPDLGPTKGGHPDTLGRGWAPLLCGVRAATWWPRRSLPCHPVTRVGRLDSSSLGRQALPSVLRLPHNWGSQA